METAFIWFCTVILATFVAMVFVHVLRRTGPTVRLLVIGYLVLGALATFAYQPSRSEALGLNRTPIAYYRTLSHWEVFQFFLLPAIGCAVGGYIVARLARYQQLTASRLGSIASGTRIELPAAALWLSALSFTLYAYGTGIETLFYSDTYLSGTGPLWAVRLGVNLNPVGVIVAANVLLGRRANAFARMAAGALLVFSVAAYFGQATRTFALCPLLIFAGGALSGRWGRRALVMRGVLATALSLALLGVPLYLRGQHSLGLLPALDIVLRNPQVFVASAANPLSNVLLGVPLSLYIGTALPPIGSYPLWVSVNPMPGSLAGWPQIAPSLRLNEFEPYSGLGELANHGALALIIYMIIAAAVFQSMEAVCLKFSVRLAGIARGSVFAISGLFLIRTTQYNLRTETRLLYGTVALVVVLWLMDRWTVRKRSDSMSAGQKGPTVEPGATLTAVQEAEGVTRRVVF